MWQFEVHSWLAASRIRIRGSRQRTDNVFVLGSALGCHNLLFLLCFYIFCFILWILFYFLLVCMCLIKWILYWFYWVYTTFIQMTVYWTFLLNIYCFVLLVQYILIGFIIRIYWDFFQLEWVGIACDQKRYVLVLMSIYKY